MGFSPELVGLPGPIKGTFGEPRQNGCPHKGLDISSTAVSKPYCAGIYGVVVLPVSNTSQWCTIAVQPFHDPTAIVQYLHSNAVNVSVGDKVAPWTILGSTGNCSPVDTPVPIHLHIQVALPGAPSQACWAQNFVDPATWPISSPMLGSWSCTSIEGGYNYTNVLTINTDASSGVIGTLQSSTMDTVELPNGVSCQLGLAFNYDLIATSTTQENVLNITAQFTSASFTDNPCNLNNNGITSADIVYEATLDSANGLSFKNTADNALLLFTRGAVIAMVEQAVVANRERTKLKSIDKINISRTSDRLLLQG